MSKTINTLMALVLVGMFPAMLVIQHYNVEEFTQEGAIVIAEKFLFESPTFSFDGIEDSVEIIEVETLRTLNTWGVSIGFTSRHGGYGDREGQMQTMALQDHRMWIVVSKGEVVEAITDSVFNELTGEMGTYQDDEVEDVQEIALNFLRNAPTFGFDGIEGSMEVVDIIIAESYPIQYFITIRFDCSQAGYGDRTNMMLAQVITTHEARVTVVEGHIINAILDNQWDELIQHEVVVSELIAPEMAVSMAIEYIQSNYPAVSDAEVPEMWTESNYNMEELVGAMKIGYSGLGWDVVVSWDVVMEPVYALNVSYGEFVWTLTVDQLLNVEEITDQIPIEIMTPDIAKDAAIYYVIKNVEGFNGLNEPEIWEYEDLTPEGLLGFSTHQFTSGEWVVVINGPVVLEPTYSVEITYTGAETLVWSGAIEPNGEIVETPSE